MIFTRPNLEKIRAGRKTETRRIWKAPHAKVGGVYRTRAARFARADDSTPRIRVTYLRTEPLARITPESVEREGCGSLEDFVLQWQELHGEWNPEQLVYVVGFEVVA